jgi:hypothetical protein
MDRNCVRFRGGGGLIFAAPATTRADRVVDAKGIDLVGAVTYEGTAKYVAYRGVSVLYLTLNATVI